VSPDTAAPRGSSALPNRKVSILQSDKLQPFADLLLKANSLDELTWPGDWDHKICAHFSSVVKSSISIV
jgi:hypothetical protein